MKTSELRSITDYGWNYTKLVKNRLMIYDGTNNTFMGSISTTQVQDYIISTNCDKITSQAIIDYAYTPLEEREDKITLIKPILNNDVELFEVNHYRCKCGSYVITDFNYCPYCGKALDWSKDE